jgi:hypothetical protein
MARPKNPVGNKSGARYTGGRPSEAVTARIGRDGMKRLKALAVVARVEPEALAAGLLSAAIEAEWTRHERETVKEWQGEVL